MSEKRMVVRYRTSQELSGSQQTNFVEDVAEDLSGTGISGYFVVCGGNGFIEWEGDEDDIDREIDEHLSDPRVSGEYEILEETPISSRDHDAWHGHASPDAHIEL